MTVEQVAERVAGSISLAWPNDRDKIFEVLSLAQDAIWKSGKFKNSTKIASVFVRPDMTLTTPPGYSILLGIDINGRPKAINDKTFLFHENGPGDFTSDMSGSKWIMDGVVDMGESPVIMQPTDVDSCKCHCVDSEPKYLIAKGIDCIPNKLIGYDNVLVSGAGCDGNRIYTYQKTDDKTQKTSCCQCETPEDLDMEGVVDGTVYPITPNDVVYTNILYSKIESITKEPTRYPVEIFAVDKSGRSVMISRMEPWQLSSRYRIYKLAKNCVNKNINCILGLFKMSKPDPIVSKNQLFIVDDIEAIISMLISKDEMFNKKDPQKAAQFGANAIVNLNADLRESKSNTRRKVQIDANTGFGKSPKF